MISSSSLMANERVCFTLPWPLIPSAISECANCLWRMLNCAERNEAPYDGQRAVRSDMDSILRRTLAHTVRVPHSVYSSVISTQHASVCPSICCIQRALPIVGEFHLDVIMFLSLIYLMKHQQNARTINSIVWKEGGDWKRLFWSFASRLADNYR